jgi:hypothetical protein
MLILHDPKLRNPLNTTEGKEYARKGKDTKHKEVQSKNSVDQILGQELKEEK